MTCVIGYENNEKVVLGGDSQATDEYGPLFMERLDTKVFEKNGMLFGTSSSIKLKQVIRYKFVIPERPVDKDLFEYMCTDFVDALFNILAENHCTVFKNDHLVGSEIIVAVEGKLFVIDEDFHVMHNKLPFFAIGSGKSIAFGSLMTLEGYPLLTPKQRIETALNVTSSLCTTVSGPFHFVEQLKS